MFKVLVTGGAGFIGSHIVDKLIEFGIKVVVIDNLSTGSIYNINKKANFYKLDIRDNELVSVFENEKPKYVIHHAAQIDIQKSIRNPMFDADVNILGTLNILNSCKKSNVEKIIYASSAAVYGQPNYLGIDEEHDINPISYYGISKYAPEHYIKVFNKLYGLKYTILRYANAYGTRQVSKSEGGVVSIFLDKMLNEGNLIIFGDGNQSRDFVYVDDIVTANILSLENGNNEVFNIGTGVGISINELYNSMNWLIGKNLKVKYEKERNGDIRHSYFDISKAKNLLGWSPIYKLENGLKEIIEFYKNLKIYSEIV